MNQPQKTLIAKDLAYAAKVGGGTIAGAHELHLLVDGAVAVFGENNVLLTTATTVGSIAQLQNFYIVVGSGTAGANATGVPFHKSEMINRDAFVQSFCPYAAPVLQKTVLGDDNAGGGFSLNLPITLVPGTEATVGVVDTSSGNVQGLQKVWATHVITASDTPATVLASLVNQLNSNYRNPAVVTILGANVGLLFTAKDVEKTFKIYSDGILINADKSYGTTSTVSATGFIGDGTPSQVLALEKESMIHRGSFNYAMFQELYFKEPYKTDAAATYSAWVWQHNNIARPGGGAIVNVNQPVTYLFVPSGATTLLANLTTIFGVVTLGQNRFSGNAVHL